MATCGTCGGSGVVMKNPPSRPGTLIGFPGYRACGACGGSGRA